MIFKALLSAFRSQYLIEKKVKVRSARDKYIFDRYQERSISNRYFK